MNTTLQTKHKTEAETQWDECMRSVVERVTYPPPNRWQQRWAVPRHVWVKLSLIANGHVLSVGIDASTGAIKNCLHDVGIDDPTLCQKWGNLSPQTTIMDATAHAEDASKAAEIIMEKYRNDLDEWTQAVAMRSF